MKSLSPFLYHHCNGPNICVRLHFYLEALTHDVMVFGAGAFEKLLGLDEVMRDSS